MDELHVQSKSVGANEEHSIYWKYGKDTPQEQPYGIRIPRSRMTRYANENAPFFVYQKEYGSLKDLTHTVQWGKAMRQLRGAKPEMVELCLDIYGRRVVHFTRLFPCYDRYDRLYEDRFDHYYYLCEDSKLVCVKHSDGDDSIYVKEDVASIPYQNCKRLAAYPYLPFTLIWDFPVVL